MNLHVDLNADLGEGAGHDKELLKLVSSASIRASHRRLGGKSWPLDGHFHQFGNLGPRHRPNLLLDNLHSPGIGSKLLGGPSRHSHYAIASLPAAGQRAARQGTLAL